MRRPSTRWLLLAVGGVVLAFLLSVAYTTSLSSVAHREAVNIHTTAVPSAALLSRVRTDLLHIDTLVDRLPPQAGPEVVDEIWAQRRLARRNFQAYRALPAYPGERRLADEAERTLLSYDEKLSAVLARNASGDQKHRHEDLQAELERADLLLQRLLDLNMVNTSRHAQAISDAWRRALRVELALDAFCVLLAVFATVMALRAIAAYEQSLERKANELEAFAGRVAHDVLSPLGAISMAVSMMQQRNREDPQTVRAAERATSSLRRVRLLVDGLLEFARAGARPDRLTCANLPAIVEGVVAELSDEAERNRIELRVGSLAPCSVACAPGVLTSLLSNLLRNAIKYMGEGEIRRVTVSAVEVDTRVHVEVADTGPGVPTDEQRGIFMPQIRGPGSPRPGIGLGLATVKRLAEAHGGAVGFRSSPGLGSTFWFELPTVAQSGRLEGGRVAGCESDARAPSDASDPTLHA